MLNILIVDDDHNLLKTLAYGLRKELGNAAHVKICSNGAEVLALYAKTNFDLIISDFNMPGMTGLELFKHIRATKQQQPVLILITAYGSNELEKEAVLFADAYITKPFDLKVLAQFIRKLLTVEDNEKVYSVLVLEDDPYLRHLISKVLKNSKFNVSEASTLREAKVFLDGTQFDVFIADIQVTDGQGTDLVREYRQVLSQNKTTVILATGESQYHYLEEELGIDMYLEKPISVQELVTIVQRWTKEKSKGGLEKYENFDR